jgi:lysophospholipase L1-like esterase
MPSWFDGEVAELERRSRSVRVGRNPILFYGSSSFTLWHDIADHFPEHNVVNHGFGGSTLADCVEYFDRLVAAFSPAVLVVYAGDNDLGDGGSPEQVLERLRAIVRRKRETLGPMPMAYVSIKISPARFALMHGIAYTNRIIERDLADVADVCFVDITRRMVGRGLGPLLAYYSEDPLHMNRDGYRVLGRSLAEYLSAVERDGGELRVRQSAVKPAWALPEVEVEAEADGEAAMDTPAGCGES